MKKGFTIISVIFICSFADAQQIGMYSHYFYKPLVYNPAYTGFGDATNAMLISRSQWTGFKDNPKLTLFTLDGSMVAKKVGWGLSLISDKKGITARTGGNLSFSYRLKINQDMRLLFGVSLGIVDQTLDFSRAIVENNTDQTLFTNAQHKTTFDGNAGLLLVWKQLEVGLTIPQMLENTVNYVDNTNVRDYYTQVRHYMASLSYRYLLSKENGISVLPQALIRFVPNTPLQFDGTVNIDWNKQFWIGIIYKSDYAVAANVGFRLYKELSIGYSYDFIIGNIGKYSGMSHELMINFKFNKNKKAKSFLQIMANLKNSVLVPLGYKPSAAIVETRFEKESRIWFERVNEERMCNLQARVTETEIQINELKIKILNPSARDVVVVAAPPPPPPPLLPLNTVLIQRLQKKIEDLLDNPKSTPAEMQEIRNDIASFLDSDIADPTAKTNMKKIYDLLEHPPSEDAPSVMVKGTIIFEGLETLKNYSTVSITITDKESNETVGIYTPNSKTGLYLFILNPGKKYLITAKTKGYQTYSEDFSPDSKTESYEISKDIKLKKE